MTAPVLFRNVRLLALESADGLSTSTDLLTEGGRIASIGEATPLPAGARVIEGNGNWNAPTEVVHQLG